MEMLPEQLISELCERVTKETDQTELRRLIAQLIESLDARQREQNQVTANANPYFPGENPPGK
jgi:hypothetical protein